MVYKFPISEKEIVEGRRAGIPEQILSKVEFGIGLTDEEQIIIKKHGKVLVHSHTKERGTVGVRPHFRNLPKESRPIGGWRIGEQIVPVIPRDVESVSNWELDRLIREASKISGTTIQNIPVGREKSEWLKRVDELYRERSRRWEVKKKRREMYVPGEHYID